MQRNARGTYERMQIARGMKGNARGPYGSGYKVPGEWRGMQGNAGECQGNVWEWMYSARGMQGSGCKVLGEFR